MVMQVGKDGSWVTGPETLSKKPAKGTQSYSKRSFLEGLTG